MNSPHDQWTIQEVSDRLDVPKSTLRYWEKELAGAIQPGRTHGGQRRYTRADILIFERVCALKKQLLTLREIKQHFLPSMRKDDSTQPDRESIINLLADRIADIVRREVSLFFAEDQRTLTQNMPSRDRKK